MGKPTLATLAKQSKLEALKKHERKMYCCSAKVWTKCIGWLQCISHGLGAAGIMYAIGGLIFSCLNKVSQQQTTLDTHAEKSNLALLLAILFVLLFTVCGGFLMGIVLLRGEYTGAAGLLCWWRAYSCLSLAIYMLLTLSRSFPPSAIAWPEVFVLIGTVVVQVFCVWIVGIRRKEFITHKEHRLVPLSELITENP